jgi:hypothetical protein
LHTFIIGKGRGATLPKPRGSDQLEQEALNNYLTVSPRTRPGAAGSPRASGAGRTRRRGR